MRPSSAKDRSTRLRTAVVSVTSRISAWKVSGYLPVRSATSDTRADKGLAVQKQIIGADRVDGLYANAPEDEQHLQRLLSANCFGDHYTRTGIDTRTREMLTLAMLISLGGADAQVKETP